MNPEGMEGAATVNKRNTQKKEREGFMDGKGIVVGGREYTVQ